MSTPCQRLASRTLRKAVISDNQPNPRTVDDVRAYWQGLVWPAHDGDRDHHRLISAKIAEYRLDNLRTARLAYPRSSARTQIWKVQLRARPSAVDLSLKRFDPSEDFIELWCVTDDHFPHSGIVFSERGGEVGVRHQAQGSGLGLVVVCPGGFEKY